MNIYIGREPRGEHTIEVPHSFSMVSRVHLEITRNDDGQVIAKDLSSNGTFVNGVQVKKVALNVKDEIALGNLENGYKLSAQSIFELIDKEVNTDKTNFANEFQALESVYNQYLKDRDQIIKKNKLKAIAPRLIITVIAMAAIWFLPIPPDKKIIFTMGAGLLGMALSSFFGKDSSNRTQLDDLTIQYNRKYVCPKCRKKLNIQSRSWKMLYEDGKCPYSKCDADYKTGS